ncbi:hypothetical protein QFC22_005188 [Naganishia vaughanmartiniae]|uniref:Uncharacterized protein n=1 Tax=Naganishia vaughanmartiniae TaxID=1424756 RepID=A0ACC2WVI3_9TREE|nr:hypothetical protein QFC22_005188 [Naganishia vaughanmartiniae]
MVQHHPLPASFSTAAGGTPSTTSWVDFSVPAPAAPIGDYYSLPSQQPPQSASHKGAPSSGSLLSDPIEPQHTHAGSADASRNLGVLSPAFNQSNIDKEVWKNQVIQKLGTIITYLKSGQELEKVELVKMIEDFAAEAQNAWLTPVVAVKLGRSAADIPTLGFSINWLTSDGSGDNRKDAIETQVLEEFQRLGLL